MLATFAHQRVVDKRNYGRRSWQFGQNIVQGNTPQSIQVEAFLFE